MELDLLFDMYIRNLRLSFAGDDEATSDYLSDLLGEYDTDEEEDEPGEDWESRRRRGRRRKRRGTMG